MRTLVIAALATSLLLSNQQAAQSQTAFPATPIPFFTLVTQGPVPGGSISEVTLFSNTGYGKDSPTSHIWVAERRRTNVVAGRATEDHQFIDSRTCPALIAALNSLDQLPSMKIGTPDRMDISPPPFDAPATNLSGPTAIHDGEGVFLKRTEYTGPLVRWKASLESSISSCWQDGAPVIPGMNVVVRLGSDEAVKGFVQ